jgi:hypothetical protein
MGNTLFYNSTPQYVLVASGSNHAAGNGTVTVTGISGTIALIVVIIGSGSVPVVTDTGGVNNYSYTTTYTAGGEYVRQAYVVNPTTTSSMTFNIISINWSAQVLVFSTKSATTPALDQQNGVGNANVSSIASGSITPGFNTELIIAAAVTGTGATGTPGAVSGYTLINLPFFTGVSQGCVIYWKSQLYIQPENVTFAGTSMKYWAAMIASYKN